jgi:hypothetical protein
MREATLMLQTPDTFQPLLSPDGHSNPASLLVYRGQLLLRNEDHALPELKDVEKLKVPASRWQALGVWQGRYYQVGWADSAELPGPDYSFVGLRTLFGVIDDGLAALAARAVQLAEWAAPTVLRGVRHAHAAPRRRALLCMSGLRHACLSAHLAGHDGAGAQGRCRAAGQHARPVRSATRRWPVSSKRANRSRKPCTAK